MKCTRLRSSQITATLTLPDFTSKLQQSRLVKACGFNPYLFAFCLFHTGFEYTETMTMNINQ